jgi:hypothetical protein
MGTNVTIFEDSSNLPTIRRPSRLAEKISVGGGLRRIQTNTNGTFKRIVSGEQIGKAIRNEIGVIVVDMLPEVSRTYYAEQYDPNGPASLPDCWSNDGRSPDVRAKDPQAKSCKACPMNVEGSGNKGRGKACRFRRHLAVLAEGDTSGEVYQLGLAAKSLFGEPVGNAHPFESYCRYLKANGEGPDTVVTRVMYDTDADTLTLKFKAARHLTQEEADLVDAALADSETQRYIQLVSTDNTNKRAAPAIEEKPKNRVVEEPADEEPDEPKARKKPVKQSDAPTPKANLGSVMKSWGNDEDEED